MHAELRRCNTIGDNRGIFHFSSVVLSDKPIKREVGRQICSYANDIRLNFNASLAFFEYLGLIKIDNPLYIISTQLGEKLHQMTSDRFQLELCRLCFQKVIDDGYLPSKVIRFDVEQGRYVIRKHGFSISAAVFRNFLIQFQALIEQPDGGLLIAEQYEEVFAELQKNVRRKMTLEDLRCQLQQQEEQGDIAEAFVLEFERRRLIDNPMLDKIKQISKIDVTAGYDIISFSDNSAMIYNRFIEVKSYKGKPHFYWTKNEIDTAKLYGERYYIYLVDIDNIDNPDYLPKIICNPINTVFDSDMWILQPNSYLVIPVV